MKWCTNCGTPLESENVKFCSSCGTPVAAAEPMQPNQPAQPYQGYQPMQPNQPASPYQGYQPVQSNQPAQPSQSYQPMQPNQPAQPYQSYQPMQPNQPASPYQAYQPMQPNQPAQPYQAYQPVQPNQPAQPYQGYQPNSAAPQTQKQSVDFAALLGSVGEVIKGVVDKITAKLGTMNKKSKMILGGAAVGVAVLVILGVVLIASSVPEASADDFIYDNDNGEIVIEQYIGDGGRVRIPDRIEGRPVIEIESEAFRGSNVTDVVVPDTVEKLGEYCFCECTELKTVKLSSSITIISNGAFEYCSSLKKVELSDSIEYIGSYAFVECTSLAKITLPDSVEALGVNVFRGCTIKVYAPKPSAYYRIGSSYCPVWLSKYTDEDDSLSLAVFAYGSYEVETEGVTWIVK